MIWRRYVCPARGLKNHRAHNIPVPPLARTILAAAPRVSERYVFSTDGIRPIAGFSKFKKRLDSLMLEEARKERGVEAKVMPFVLHDLRRSMASGCAAIGIQPHIIEAALNHVSGAAKAGVAGVYNVEAYETERAAALNRWAAHIEGIVSGSETAKVVSLRR
jgi:integrase